MRGKPPGAKWIKFARFITTLISGNKSCILVTYFSFQHVYTPGGGSGNSEDLNVIIAKKEATDDLSVFFFERGEFCFMIIPT